MKIEVKKYLYDIQTSINSIENFLDGKRDYNVYKKNRLLRRGVEREIEIIGEAMNKILKIQPECKIKHARRIVDTRNWVIHAYDSVDDVVIWNIVVKHLPKLKIEIDSLFDQMDQS